MLAKKIQTEKLIQMDDSQMLDSNDIITYNGHIECFRKLSTLDIFGKSQGNRTQYPFRKFAAGRNDFP